MKTNAIIAVILIALGGVAIPGSGVYLDNCNACHRSGVRRKPNLSESGEKRSSQR